MVPTSVVLPMRVLPCGWGSIHQSRNQRRRWLFRLGPTWDELIVEIINDLSIKRKIIYLICFVLSNLRLVGRGRDWPLSSRRPGCRLTSRRTKYTWENYKLISIFSSINLHHMGGGRDWPYSSRRSWGRQSNRGSTSICTRPTATSDTSWSWLDSWWRWWPRARLRSIRCLGRKWEKIRAIPGRSRRTGERWFFLLYFQLSCWYRLFVIWPERAALEYPGQALTFTTRRNSLPYYTQE